MNRFGRVVAGDISRHGGAAVGHPTTLLRVEYAAMLLLAIIAYAVTDGGLGRFALLFLAPDLAALGYFASARIGAIAYNLAHTVTAPAALAIAGLLVGSPLAVSLALIWFAHIAMDRLLGYGLKNPAAALPGTATAAPDRYAVQGGGATSAQV